MGKAVGLAEFNSIAKGLEMLDKMTKKADVKIVENRVVCIGKFFIMVSGLVADVESAINEVVEESGKYLVESKVIPSIMEGVLEKINAKIDRKDVRALGIVEARNVSIGLYCSNYIKKFSNVDILKISLTYGLGGKAFVVFSGDLSSVESGIAVAKDKVGDPSKVVSAVVIPSPSREFIENFL